MDVSEIAAQLREVVDYEIVRIGGTDVTVISILLFLVALAVFFVAARLLGRTLARWTLGRTSVDESVTYALSRVVQYIVVAIGVMVSFQFLGIDLSSLAILLGALGVGIGLGLQSITANFVSGLVLLFERPVRVGDRVRIGDLVGDVEAINMRATTIRSVLNVAVVVPNSDFTNQTIINLSLDDPRLVIRLEVGVSYDSDLDLVLSSLQEVAEAHPLVLEDPPPVVRLLGFGDSAWNLAVFAWIGDVRQFFAVRSELYAGIIRSFRRHGIEIPYPQRDLHLRSAVELPVGIEPQASPSGPPPQS